MQHLLKLMDKQKRLILMFNDLIRKLKFKLLQKQSNLESGSLFFSAVAVPSSLLGVNHFVETNGVVRAE